MEVFSPEWAAAWQASINADAAYREAGRKWVGAVVLKAWADEGARLAHPSIQPGYALAAGEGAGTDPVAGAHAVDSRDQPTGQGGVRAWSVWADLEAGHCREARVATAGDEAHARIVVSAPLSTWTEVLAGRLDPIMGLMRGRLQLERGSLVSLVPHARGARALLTTAARMEAELPGSARDGGVGGPGEPTRDVGATPAKVSGPVLDRGGDAVVGPAPPVVDGADWVPKPPASTVAGRASTRSFQSTRSGLDHDAFPMRLWHKAKKLGVWDPRDIALERDREDWERLDDLERDVLLRLAALFQAGEEAVTLDLLPLMGVVAAEGRLEEEMYLTSFLWEEAKHVEAFRRFIDEVAQHEGDLDRYATPSYRTIFEQELPTSLQRLRTDASPAAQARAAVVYNMIVEGVLAETGYHGYQRILEDNGIMPGMQQMVRQVKRDESRHIAYGLYLLSRLVAENGEAVRALIEDEMARLLDPALEVITEVFDAYAVMPFGLELDVFTAFGVNQFQHRLGRLEKAWESGSLVAEVGEAVDGQG